VAFWDARLHSPPGTPISDWRVSSNEASYGSWELQVFLTVAREGSFSRAAERLFRTQPAVSLAIRKLEDGLGQPLFVRGRAQCA